MDETQVKELVRLYAARAACSTYELTPQHMLDFLFQVKLRNALEANSNGVPGPQEHS